MQVYTSATHWGVFTARVHGGDIAAVAALASDTNPAPQLQNLPGAVRHRSRIANPAVRRGWLQHGPGPSSARGAEEFVEVSWDELIELLASELRRTVDRYGNEAIYGSSYGWASAGRFHHAQSQVHRFLNMLGGYTASRHSYSAGASEVIFPHIVGAALFEALAETTTWDVIVDHTALLVAFGAGDLRDLARRMAEHRTLITTSLSLQRIEHGEQTVWMAATLAAMLGQIGLPGGGFGHGYSSNGVGNPPLACGLPALPQGNNPVSTFIPVAAISELLQRPGQRLAYNGRLLELPDIKCVYWAGGNPFHHHQNLPRLRRALSRVDTIVVHEQYWTAMAKHADIVVPTTTSFERDDFAASKTNPTLIAMPAMVPPYANARDDYHTFSALAHRLGFGKQFTEGRSAREWLEHMYDKWSAELDFPVPSFAEFWRTGRLELPTRTGLTWLADFRADPAAHPLGTPSGRIEIFSDTVDAFALPDCAGHPTWYEPSEWLGGPRAARYPLHLIANQPRTRLHSQLDHGGASMASKIRGREPIRIHPDDAAARELTDGDIVRVFNDRGACLAGVVIDDGLRPKVVQLSTGAWFDPADPRDPDSMCVHGNPNALSNDSGTSSLAHGSTGQHVLVQIERFTGELPPVRAHEPPRLA